MIVRIQGGLGNQMFQYAFAKALAIKYGNAVALDNSGFQTDSFITKRDYRLDAFNVSLSLADEVILSKSKGFNQNRFLSKLRKKAIRLFPWLAKNVRLEKSLLFDSHNLDKCDYYEGYWQSEKYFQAIIDVIKKEFIFKNTKRFETNTFLSSIKESESVSIHVRRGDYVNNPKVNEYHGSLQSDYYLKAIEVIKNKVSNSKFYVFSDDIEWVSDNMFSDLNAVFVKTTSDEEDMYLMSQCKHNIIANSSFSWWGAYLNNNESKVVVAPLKWFRNEEMNKRTLDLVLTNWFRV
jgi:hypothetical protein